MGYIDGLPVGLSFFGRAWSEPTLIEIAYALEQITDVRKAPRVQVLVGRKSKFTIQQVVLL